MPYPKPPKPFLEAIVHDVASHPPLAALCAGYETGNWRATALAEHLLEWLPEFCLSAEELTEFEPGSALRLIRKSAQLVYQTDKYGLRGEFGEMFLHLALRQLYNSIPAISKIYWKDSVNTTVKGFDAVHVVESNGALELWLGEVKFYENASRAIADVVAELKAHTEADYLKREFSVITNKLDKQDQHYATLSKLLDPNTSLDAVFSAACVPVLITYNSAVVRRHRRSDKAYLDEIKKEVMGILEKFATRVNTLALPIKVHLFVVPLHTKIELLRILDNRLKALQ
jgi:hypothetical protein